MRKFLAVSIPPLSDREVDRVLDISGRQIGVITPLVANIISPPQEAKSSVVNLVFMFNRIGAKVFYGEWLSNLDFVCRYSVAVLDEDGGFTVANNLIIDLFEKLVVRFDPKCIVDKSKCAKSQQ